MYTKTLEVSVQQLQWTRDALSRADAACVNAIQTAANAAQRMRADHETMLQADRMISQLLQQSRV